MYVVRVTSSDTPPCNDQVIDTVVRAELRAGELGGLGGRGEESQDLLHVSSLA